MVSLFPKRTFALRQIRHFSRATILCEDWQVTVICVYCWPEVSNWWSIMIDSWRCFAIRTQSVFSFDILFICPFVLVLETSQNCKNEKKTPILLLKRVVVLVIAYRFKVRCVCMCVCSSWSMLNDLISSLQSILIITITLIMLSQWNYGNSSTNILESQLEFELVETSAAND